MVHAAPRSAASDWIFEYTMKADSPLSLRDIHYKLDSLSILNQAVPPRVQIGSERGEMLRTRVVWHLGAHSGMWKWIQKRFEWHSNEMVLGTWPEYYCARWKESLVCSNHRSLLANPPSEKTGIESEVLMRTYPLWRYMMERLEYPVGRMHRERVGQWLSENLPRLSGNLTRRENQLGFEFSLQSVPEGVAYLLKNKQWRVKTRVPEDSRVALYWNQPRRHWKEFLESLSLAPEIPAWHLSSDSLTYIVTDAGPYLGYYYHSKKKYLETKKQVRPKKKIRKYYTNLRHGGFTGFRFRLGYRGQVKQAFWLFENNWMYMFTRKTVYPVLTRKAILRKLPPVWLRLEAGRFADFPKRKDDQKWIPPAYRKWILEIDGKALRILWEKRKPGEPVPVSP